MTVPPAHQCTLPSCEQEKAEPTELGGLCSEHLDDISSENASEKADSGGDTPGVSDRKDTLQAGHLLCLQAAMEFFHDRLDETIQDHTEAGQYPDRPTTARDYFRDYRGWTDETINEKLLGWAPPERYALRDHLQNLGYSREEMLATGLFGKDLSSIWQGRYVLPYFDADGHPIYAIARCTGAKGGGDAGYDGHPADFHAGKYAKLAHTKDHAKVDEPIYGTATIEPGEPLIITEGIADAITAHEAGYPCISPVTKQFKQKHYEPLLDLLDEHDVPRVYLVQDNEAPASELRETDDPVGITDVLTVYQHGEGLKGAVATGTFLAENGVNAYLAELPRVGTDKVDLDDYLVRWEGSLRPVLASGVPVDQHPAYEPPTASESKANAIQAAKQAQETVAKRTGSNASALFDLEITDVTSLSEGYRGTNPLGHHGTSKSYYVVINGGELGYDHKSKAAYNGLTHLLCEAGERRPSDPNGPVDDDELLAVWVYAKDAGYIPDDDPIPHTALCHVAVSNDLCDPQAIEDGWRLPRQVFNDALALVEDEYDVEPGRTPISGREDNSRVTFDPEDVWRAASEVTDDDLDGELGLEVTTDGWRCPVTGAIVDVVQAVAIAEGLIDRSDELLADREYDEAVRRARTHYDAPLPEYVTAETVTDNWHLIQGALGQLEHWHLKHIKSNVTGVPDDDGVIAEINPVWADSASEERIIAYEGSGFYDRKHERAIDPLRFVALESGLIDEPGDELSGETFKQTYHIAREEYGAPLPEWTIGDPDHIPVLPPAEELLETFATDTESLAGAREKVEELYRNVADDNGEASIVDVLPALGKTTSAVKHAGEHPALYIAPRKELQQQAAEKAAKHDVSSYILPVFAEHHVGEEALQQACAIVRDEGKDILKDREELADRVNAPIFPVEDEEDNEETVELARASSPVANGEYGEEWALAVQVASELGHPPRDILSNGKTLFGEEPPRPDNGDPYSQAWERATDPEQPIDLLIGSYGHGYVAGARTHYRKENGHTKLQARTVVIDEFPGLGAFGQDFGERYLDHAGWLAESLRTDVDDRQAMFDADLWGDEWVRNWIRGNGDADPTVERAITALDAMRDVLGALEAIEELRKEYSGAVDSLGLTGALARVAECHPTWEAEAAQQAYYTLSDAVKQAGSVKGAEYAVLDRLDEDVLPVLAEFVATVGDLSGELAVNAVADPVSADLRDLCVTAGEMFTDRADGARGVLDAARVALKGGEDGCRALSLHADSGYAHPKAYLLLYGQLASDESVTTIGTNAYTYDDKGGTTIDQTRLGQSTILTDRNQHGAFVHHPPEFIANHGTENPVVGLDATANQRLWSIAIGRDVSLRDIHSTPTQRRQFLRDVLNLQVVQTSEHTQSYSGPTASKNFDADVALVEEIAREYGKGRLRQDKLTQTTDPGVITTKKVREEIEERVEPYAHAVDNYGNVTGSNALSQCNLGVVLGCRHFGDPVVEKWAAMAGEEVTRSGHGNDLDYGSETANAMLGHMREDETMQAILRFGRDEEGAVVFAHTSALREDLPVIGEAAVVQAHSDSAKEVARAAREHRERQFTAGDLADHVSCSRRTVRRVLGRFAELGYLRRHDTGEGLANEYRQVKDPGVGHADLPEVGEHPDNSPQEEYYTWSVRVDIGDSPSQPRPTRPGPVLPAPTDVADGPPPD